MNSPDKPILRHQSTEPRADWLAWSLHLALGFIVGGAAGMYLIPRLMNLRYVGIDELHLVILGAALLGGGVAACRGNRAWITPSILDPASPPQSTKSRACAVVIASVGVAIMAFAMARHIPSADFSNPRSSWSFVGFFLLLCEAGLGWIIFRACRTGEAPFSFGTVNRDDTPLYFWIWLTAACLTFVSMLFQFPR